MTNKQIQPVRSRDLITQRARPRGLWGQVWMVVLQPAYFFRTLPMLADTRSWLWAAVLILALAGIAAVRQDALLNGGSAAPGEFGVPSGGLGGDFSGPVGPAGGFTVSPIEGGGGGGGGGDMPFDSGIPNVLPSAGSTSDTASTWTTALLAAAAMIFGWFVLTIVLSEVTLFNGRMPSLGQNFQVAIWASIPFALMAALQLIYYSAGGEAGAAGVSGLLAEWEGYNDLPAFWQSIILSLTSRMTLFWLWSLILIYIGARHALHGKRWSSALVVVMWVVILVVAPVLTGAVKPPETQSAIQPDLSQIPALPDNMDELFGIPGESFEAFPPDGSSLEVTAEPGESGERSTSGRRQVGVPAQAAPGNSRPIIIRPAP